jgi:hypothetical protein
LKPFWTILLTFVLAFLPAGGAVASETGKSDCGSLCARCCCCVQPQNSPPQTQNVPLSSPSRSVSLERFSEQVDTTVATPAFPAAAQSDEFNCDSRGFRENEPLFQRFCSLLI